MALNDPQWLSGDALRRVEENFQLPNWSIGQLDPVKWLINPESRAARRSPEQHLSSEAADLCCSVSTIAEAAKGTNT